MAKNRRRERYNWSITKAVDSSPRSCLYDDSGDDDDALQGRDPASVPVSSLTTSTGSTANPQGHSKLSHKH